jgi:hypothetical protein
MVEVMPLGAPSGAALSEEAETQKEVHESDPDGRIVHTSLSAVEMSVRPRDPASS